MDLVKVVTAPLDVLYQVGPGRGLTVPPATAFSSVTRLSPSSLMSLTTTNVPSFVQALAMPSPKLEPDSVITVTLFASCIFFFSIPMLTC